MTKRKVYPTPSYISDAEKKEISRLVNSIMDNRLDVMAITQADLDAMEDRVDKLVTKTLDRLDALEKKTNFL